MEVDVDAFREAQAERYCQLVAACLIVYEFILQFDNEIEYFWKKRWSMGKILFLWSRYYSVAFNVFHESPGYLGCDKFFHWQNTGAAIQVITTHIILELRLYAMYSNNKVILGLLVLLAAAEATVMGVLFGIKKPLVGTNNPAPGVFICADADQAGHPWIAFYFTSTLAIEGILLGLSLWKAWVNHRSSIGNGLMSMLTKDSVSYFAIIFWIYLGNQIIWVVNDLTLNEVATGFSFSISAILANRLMISVRKSYYDTSIHDLTSHPMDTLGPAESLHFATPLNRDIELETFEETRGF